MQESWRFFQPTAECFLLDNLPPQKEFLQLKMRPSTSFTPFSVFHKFLDEKLVKEIADSVPGGHFDLGERSDREGRISRQITPRHIWQAIAIQVLLTGNQVRAKESDPNKHFLQERVQYAKDFLQEKTGEHAYSRNLLLKVISNCFLEPKHASLLSSNFCGILESLGQFAAGDEKLFHFTGNSSDVRLVISKPDRLGLWFYELCGKLPSGEPFMLDVFLHHNTSNTVSVQSVVNRWLKVLKFVGKEKVPDNQHPNPKCYLIADSYYLDKSVRNLMLQEENLDQKFSFSVRGDRMKAEQRMVHPPDSTPVEGEYKAIVKEDTNETFLYHYDTQKGVGIKYNYARGFVRSLDKRKVKERNVPGRVPVYEYYKNSFEICDRFNRRLHDACFPHKRGGNGLKGEFGCHHDFLMAVILENTRNTYCYLKSILVKDCNFNHFCELLAIQIFQHSFT